MCGIIGFKGTSNLNAVDVILHGLKTLEYRGYDSWGIAVLQNSPAKKPSISVLKAVGKIGLFDDLKKKKKLGTSSMGIGHTRWATHGAVTKTNAHPQLTADKSIAVVHNGIVENYQELRSWLEERGYKFSSQTDTEVIPHLFDYYLKKGLPEEEAARKTFLRLKGHYAVVILNKSSQKILAAKNGSPLVAGFNDKDLFVASDVPAFLKYTRKVIFLDDMELVVLNDGISLFDIKSGRRKRRKHDTISWSPEQAKKGNYPHFMIKEIEEQHESIRRAINQDDKKIMEIASQIKNSFGTFFVGCGSSFHAALTASYLFSMIANKHINVVLGSEFPNYISFLKKDSLIIPISQSGETADILDAVRAAKKKKSKIYSIVNVMGSSLMRMSDHTFLMNAGPEICVLSTKSYTSQLVVLTLLAYASAGRLQEGKEELLKAARHVEDYFKPEYGARLKKLASRIAKYHHIFVIGRSLNYPTALEAALKIKEVSYIHAEGFPGGELKHGSIALIEKNTPCFVFAPMDETYHEILSNAMEIKSRGGYIIGVSPKDNKIFDFHIPVPKDHFTSPILNIIPIQILAYHLAVKLGRDPDKPRNLAKSVTVR
ncbi:glutamine--fructose-6-phosphate transaminase (isomerizing) [Candidatus Woesearchaeota archaeon]|nr:MAG: glutamine--fructose-6-phosphate transaminase (isomerizing) [Candidatus Woesearchaeota archaeon]